MDFEDFVRSKVRWSDTPYFEKLIEAACQVDQSTSEYLKDHMSRSWASKLYRKMFDLSLKGRSTSVNRYLYELYDPSARICSMCKKIKRLEDFHKQGSGKRRSNCKECFLRFIEGRRIPIRQIALDLFGAYACQICGYNRTTRALHFHHKNPKQKEFRIHDMYNESYDKIKTEIEKCVLVCANCHYEIHDGFYPEYLELQ